MTPPGTELAGWPRNGRDRRAVLANMERYLEADGRVHKLVTFAFAGLHEPTGDAPLPAELGELFALCERNDNGKDLAAELSGADLNGLWDALCARAHGLARAGRVPPAYGTPATLPPWQRLALIAICAAEGMTYAIQGLEAELWSSERRRSWWRESAKALEILAVSIVSLLRHDLPGLGKLTRSALRGGVRALCRHYAKVVVALFVAGKRVAPLDEPAWVIPITGRTHRYALWGHAWNWYASARREDVVAFDLTGADWLLDRGQASSIFNRGFDATRWDNVSAFLGSLLRDQDAGSPLAGAPVVARTLARHIRPGTLRGDALLFRIARQPMLHPEARLRVEQWLEGRGFGKLFPGWRLEIRLLHGLGDQMASLGLRGLNLAAQHALLDGIGL